MREQNLDMPEMPNVCLTCGDRGHLTPRKVNFTYTSRQNELLSMLASLLGLIYYNETVYTLNAPLCSGCASNFRWSKIIIWLMWPALVVLLIVAFSLWDDPVPIVALPSVFLVGCCVAYLVLRKRGVPKTAELNNDRLILSVPRFGDLTVFDNSPATYRRTQPKKAATPQLNRSVCDLCGFINFAGMTECRKCRAPIGSSAGV